MVTIVPEVTMLKSQIKLRIAEYELRTNSKFIKKKAAEELGMNATSFSSLVTGTTFTTAEKMFKLANMLGCKVDDLYIYEEE